MPVSLHGGESSLPRSWAVELPQQVDHYPGPPSLACRHSTRRAPPRRAHDAASPTRAEGDPVAPGVAAWLMMFATLDLCGGRAVRDLPPGPLERQNLVGNRHKEAIAHGGRCGEVGH